jgi:hypothetical protein
MAEEHKVEIHRSDDAIGVNLNIAVQTVQRGLSSCRLSLYYGVNFNNLLVGGVLS